jgi:signal transduction histidine kinase
MLIVVAVIPAACVLWFMGKAVQNEHLAVQERLTGVYTNHLASVQRRIDEFWKKRLKAIDSVPGGSPATRFAEITHAGLADSAIVLDPDGTSFYPAPTILLGAGTPPEPEGWRHAMELEFQEQDFAGAAETYEKIASETAEPGLKARALVAQANSLLKADEKDSAISVLTKLVNDNSLTNATGSQETLILPNVQLRLLKLLGDSGDARFQETIEKLVRRLNDYSDALLSASQRRFLMEQILELERAHSDAYQAETEERFGGVEPIPVTVLFPMLEAEHLAAEYLETVDSQPEDGLLSTGELSDLWHVKTPNGSVVALFKEEKIRMEMLELMVREFSLADATIELILPGETRDRRSPVPTLPASEMLPGWSLALAFTGPDPFSAASRHQTLVYRWTGALVIGTIALLAFVLACYLTAQMRLTQMKNELVSTVSHELKTPLASMRALVDTLLANRIEDPKQSREYLELISKENHRLSHLIENFLTFSRIERGKQQFRFESISPEVIARDAAEALKDRLESSQCQFTVGTDNDLPDLSANRDALTTVLVNLLDNALKYSGKDKRIRLRVFMKGNHICFEVSDNGLGLNAAERKHIFDRFYQADQSLTRQRGGCGLGLSIVQHIVNEHRGTVEVESEPEKGSVFRVRIPFEHAKQERDPSV